MIIYHCRVCWQFIKREVEEPETGRSITDTRSVCDQCTKETTAKIHHNSKKMTCKKGHPFDGIRNLSTGELERYCKTCMKEADQRFKAKKRAQKNG